MVVAARAIGCGSSRQSARIALIITRKRCSMLFGEPGQVDFDPWDIRSDREKARDVLEQIAFRAIDRYVRSIDQEELGRVLARANVLRKCDRTPLQRVQGLAARGVQVLFFGACGLTVFHVAGLI